MNDLEQQLSDHFRTDGENAAPQFRLDDIISGNPMAPMSTATQRRSWLRPTLAAAAVVAVTVGGLVIATRAPQEQPPAAANQFSAINWSTENVTFAASAFTIDANDQTFTTEDTGVDFDSDPGDDSYQTLEITWTENDVEMRWYVYFASDGIDWWATEFRTYDGTSDSEWITFTGEFFRTPLGTPFVGDVDLNATERGITSRVRIENMVLQPFTTNDILPAPPLAGGNPPPLPTGLPRTGVEWTPDGNLALAIADQTLMQECMSDAGWNYDIADSSVLAETFGQWNPHPVLSVRSVKAAQAFGYHLDERQLVGVDAFAQTLTPSEREEFYVDLNGGDNQTMTPITLPDGTETGASVVSDGCFGASREAFDNLINDQEALRQVVQESGIDQEQVAGDTEQDQRIQTALATWRACVEGATGENAETPDELARRYAFEAGTTDREIEIATADARCQTEIDLDNLWSEVYAEYQRFALGDDADLFDTLALMRVDIIERANTILNDRGITIPTI
jgi:hypothetical protein